MDVLNPANVDQYVFHYTTREKTLEGILQRQPSLRLGRFIDTKDPYENKDWNFGVTTSGARDNWAINTRIWDASKRLQNALRLTCLTRDCLSDGAETPVEIRGFGLSRMWDRYGEVHRGFCLAFDKNALGRAVGETIAKQETEHERLVLPGPPTRWAQEVTYGILVDRSPAEWSIDGDRAEVIGSEDAVVGYHLATHYERLLFLKSKDWEGEREYRHVYWGRPETPDLDVPITESLRGIILGVDFPQVYLPTLQAIRPAEAVIYQMRWNWGHFQQLSVV